MDSNSLPLVRASALRIRGSTVFRTTSNKVEVVAPQSLLHDIIELCDGTRRYSEVEDSLGQEWDLVSIRELIETLYTQGVIVDAQMLWREFREVTANPSRFPTTITEARIDELVVQAKIRQRSNDEVCNLSPRNGPVSNVLRKRASIREFSGESIGLQSLVDILWSAYGEYECKDGKSHKTSPSAGALYPLDIRVILFVKTDSLEIGVYKAYYSRAGKVGFELLSQDIHSVLRSYLDPASLKNANGVIVIGGHVELSGEKYGNRSMLYVPLEAGHVAQNVLLQATELEIATFEIGGFIDELLTAAAWLAPTYSPLTTIAFGQNGAGENVLSDSPYQVSWAVPTTSSYRPSFSIASVRVSEDRSWSHGRDPNPELALIKAVAEAKEWAACGCIPKLTEGKYADLESVIDPRSVISFHQAQYRIKGFPFRPFDESLEYAWTKGYNHSTGSIVYLLAEQVYFPFFPKTPDYCFSNSSGCAANPNEDKVIETAVLELVERDSFMNAYLGRLSLPIVSEKTLPTGIQGRLRDLKSVGVEVWVVDHSLDLAPVAMVFAQSENLAFTTCASCSSFDLEYAVGHALMEVEASVLARLQNGSRGKILPSEEGCLWTTVSSMSRGDITVGQTSSLRRTKQSSSGRWDPMWQQTGKSFLIALLRRD